MATTFDATRVTCTWKLRERAEQWIDLWREFDREPPDSIAVEGVADVVSLETARNGASAAHLLDLRRYRDEMGRENGFVVAMMDAMDALDADERRREDERRRAEHEAQREPEER